MDRGVVVAGVLGAALYFGLMAMATSGEKPAAVGIGSASLSAAQPVPPGQYAPLDLTQTMKLAYKAATRSPEVNNAAVVYFHEVPKGYDWTKLRESIGKGLSSGSIKLVVLDSEKSAVVPETKVSVAPPKLGADLSSLRVVTFAASAPFAEATANPQKWVTFGAKTASGGNF